LAYQPIRVLMSVLFTPAASTLRASKGHPARSLQTGAAHQVLRREVLRLI
jgi:hypothetical protein